MRKIALVAVAFAIAGTLTNIAVAGAHAAQYADTTLTTAKAQTTAAKPQATLASASTGTTVIVKPGDTLSGIAAAHGTTYMRLQNANPYITNPNLIYPGNQIRIPGASAPTSYRTAPVAKPAPKPAAPAPAPAAISASDAEAKAYIYFHESSNNPNATNYLGCYGLGQDCSGKLRPQCGADWACQDRFFTNYMKSRYGTWQNALAFWKANHWW